MPRLPRSLFLTTGLVFVFFGLGPQAALAAGSLLILLTIVALLWRPGEPPALLCVFVFQWLEASIWIFYANILDIYDWSAAGTGREQATILLLLALAVQSLGVRLAMGPPSTRNREIAEYQLVNTSQMGWLKLYIGAGVVAAAATFLAKAIPPLSQPLLALVYLRWTAYVIFTAASFFRAGSSRSLWLGVFFVELALSIGGYFSSFKFVFLLTFLGLAASQVRLSPRRRLLLAMVAIVALLFGAVWSSIKGEYRYFVSGGQRAQVVMVNYAERIGKIGELVPNLGWEGLLDGFDLLVRRIEYVEYFGFVTTYVPAVEPHAHGALWLDAVARPLMPRLLFPDKPGIDESYVTNKFTGLSVAGFDEGTQVSIGYVAETYVDFGKYGMMLVLFIWGLFLGRTYRWLLQSEYSRGVLGMGLVSATLVMTSGSIGNGLAKLVGGVVVSLLVMWLFNRLIVPRWLPWLRAYPSDGAASRRALPLGSSMSGMDAKAE